MSALPKEVSDGEDRGAATSLAVAPPRRLTAGERRAKLLAGALELFAERGFRATTMEDIAEAAGVTKPLVYQHFSSKRALYLELVESVAQQLLTAIAEATGRADGPRAQVELGLAAYFHLVVTHEAAFRLLFGRDTAGDEELGKALGRVEVAIAEAIDPLINAGLNPEHRRFLAYAVVGMAEGAGRQWIATRAHEERDRQRSGQPSSERSPEDLTAEAQRLADRLADLAWAGLRSVHAN